MNLRWSKRGRKREKNKVKLVVGLGNYPEKYWLTKHNIGFLTVQEYVRKHNLKWRKEMFHPFLSAKDEGRDVLFLLPLTYMNNSGKAVGYFRNSVDPEDMLLICDDLNLPWFRMRLRYQGSSGGHRGLESVFNALGTNKIPRLRLGIDRPKDGDVVEYVLSPFEEKEREDLPVYLSAAFATVDRWVDGEDPQRLMSLVNDPDYVRKYFGGEDGAEI